jgi:cytochrome P450
MEYNPFLPEVQQDPYPYYAYLRQHAPVYQVPGLGFWAVSRYDDVFALLRNPQAFSSSGFASALAGDLNPFPPEAPAIIENNPPDHTRLRKLANRGFTPRRVASLEVHIREVTHRLIEQLPTQGTFDLVREFSIPLPVIVIAELLGVPTERYRDFKRWSDDLVSATKTVMLTPEERERIRQSTADLYAYLRDAIAAYRKQPGDNLLSDLVRAEEENQILTAEEVQSLAVFLLFAGNETTTNLIGNAMLALLGHPEELRKVQENPTLIPNLVEEVLRYDGPIQLLPRQTTQEVEIAGTTIPAGAVVMPLLGSANRDERKFPTPDRFDVTRNADGQVGFGFGIHFCLGAELARLEGRVALEALLGRFPALALKEPEVPRIASLLIRGPQTLPLVVG